MSVGVSGSAGILKYPGGGGGAMVQAVGYTLQSIIMYHIYMPLVLLLREVRGALSRGGSIRWQRRAAYLYVSGPYIV